MPGYKREFIDGDNDFYQLVTSGSNTYAIWLLPKTYMAVHDGTTLGLQTLSLQGVEKIEVEFSLLDDIGSIGGYTVDPTTNSLIFILDQTTVYTNAEAKAYITGYLLEYQMETLEYYSTSDALYVMTTVASDGTEIGSTGAASTGTLISKMLNYDSEQDINSHLGPFEHTFRRALITA